MLVTLHILYFFKISLRPQALAPPLLSRSAPAAPRLRRQTCLLPVAEVRREWRRHPAPGRYASSLEVPRLLVSCRSQVPVLPSRLPASVHSSWERSPAPGSQPPPPPPGPKGQGSGGLGQFAAGPFRGVSGSCAVSLRQFCVCGKEGAGWESHSVVWTLIEIIFLQPQRL